MSSNLKSRESTGYISSESISQIPLKSDIKLEVSEGSREIQRANIVSVKSELNCELQESISILPIKYVKQEIYESSFNDYQEVALLEVKQELIPKNEVKEEVDCYNEYQEDNVNLGHQSVCTDQYENEIFVSNKTNVIKNEVLREFEEPELSDEDSLRTHLNINNITPYLSVVCNRSSSVNGIDHLNGKTVTSNVITITPQPSIKKFLKVHGNSCSTKPYECDICKKKFARQNYLQRHMNMHNNVMPHMCNICKKRFTLQVFLERHMYNIHSNVETYKCDDCGKEFRQKWKFILHMKEYNSLWLCKCHICGKQLRSKTRLKNHLKVHNDVPYVCADCGKGFSKRNHLKAHLYSIHRNLKLFACDNCGKAFFHKRNLIKHISINCNSKPYVCIICGKAFTNKLDLQTHTNVHKNMKFYVCYVCGKGIKHKNNLIYHMNKHKKIHPHECNVCGKMFTKKGSLKTHMNIHSSVKPYMCTECGKGFNQKYPLQTHMNLHKNLKPFVCNDCGKECTQKRTLIKHLYTHNNVKPHVSTGVAKGKQVLCL